MRKERGSALSKLPWRRTFGIQLLLSTENELEYRTHVLIVVRRLRWWNVVSVYHRLWPPSAFSGLPQIHIRRAVESWRKYWEDISSPVIAELCRGGEIGKVTIYTSSSRLLFLTGWCSARAFSIYSRNPIHSRSSIKIKRAGSNTGGHPIGLYCSRQQWKGYADALSLVKTLRSNRASNLAKCSNFFPFTLALLASPLPRPFYWQVGMFALCIASPRFIPNREKDSFSEEEANLFLSSFWKWKFFPLAFFVPRPGSMVWYSFRYVIGGQGRVLVVQFDAWWVCNSWRWADDGRIGGRRIDRLFLALVVVIISFVPRKNSYLALSASTSVIRGRCSLRLALKLFLLETANSDTYDRIFYLLWVR